MKFSKCILISISVARHLHRPTLNKDRDRLHSPSSTFHCIWKVTRFQGTCTVRMSYYFCQLPYKRTLRASMTRVPRHQQDTLDTKLEPARITRKATTCNYGLFTCNYTATINDPISGDAQYFTLSSAQMHSQLPIARCKRSPSKSQIYQVIALRPNSNAALGYDCSLKATNPSLFHATLQ